MFQILRTQQMPQDRITWMIRNKEIFEADKFFADTGIESRDIEYNFELHKLASDPEIIKIAEEFAELERKVPQEHTKKLHEEK